MQNNSSDWSKYIPNAITILSWCCGLTSIKFSLSQEWKISIYLIIFAAIFDFFEGGFARKLKGGSNFGAELDSLRDFIALGVAPSILIYFGTLTPQNPLGWRVVWSAAACAAPRLARITAEIYLTNKPIDTTVHGTGIPPPAAAG
jgi:Phosphatidylserine synthase